METVDRFLQLAMTENSRNLKVTENKEKGVVVVGEHEVEGFIDKRVCPDCQLPRIYYNAYDAYFCPQCNLWLESVCGDPTCEYCRDRPEKPLS